MRQDGKRLDEIATALNMSRSGVKRIVKLTQERLDAACKVYLRKVEEPLVYGIWHTYTAGDPHPWHHASQAQRRPRS